MRLRVRYTDGSLYDGDCASWPALRGDGVDAVWIGEDDPAHPQGTPLIGYPLYWLYQEGDGWVAGRAAVGNNERAREFLYASDGSVSIRDVFQGIPDLRHEDLKVGWWR